MTSIAEVENQIEHITAKRADVLRDIAALSAREKTLREARAGELAGELFDNRKAGGRLRAIDADLEKLAARAQELQDLLGAADARLADLRQGMARVQFDADVADWPGLCVAVGREQATVKASRGELLAALIRLNQLELLAGRMYERIQRNERALGQGQAVRESLPAKPPTLWYAEQVAVTHEMASGASIGKAASWGLTRAQLGDLVTK